MYIKSCLLCKTNCTADNKHCSILLCGTLNSLANQLCHILEKCPFPPLTVHPQHLETAGLPKRLESPKFCSRTRGVEYAAAETFPSSSSPTLETNWQEVKHARKQTKIIDYKSRQWHFAYFLTNSIHNLSIFMNIDLYGLHV